MLNIILHNNIIYYGIGVMFAVGVVAKIITSRKMNILANEAKEMKKSTEPFLKLVKAKYEHSSMVNNGVENVAVFVDKYLRELKVCGLNLHTWGRVRAIILLIIASLATTGAVLRYAETGMVVHMTTYIAVGMLACVLLIGVNQSVDENYRLTTIRIYMMDYLENVMANRLNRKNGARENRVENAIKVGHKPKRRQAVKVKEIVNQPIKNIEAETATENIEAKEMLSYVKSLEKPEQEESLEGKLVHVSIAAPKANINVMEDKPLMMEEVLQETKEEQYEEEEYIIPSAYTATTEGTSLDDASNVQEQQVQKLEMAKLLKEKIQEAENKRPTPSETLIRDILQEFMA